MRFFWLLCLALSTTIMAQDLGRISSFQDLQKKVTKSTPLQMPESPVIEHPVDEELYIVGPGDVFSLIVSGNAEEEQHLMVTPEGSLVFPSIGAVDVSGLTLAAAKQQMLEHLNEQYIAENISLSLIQVRTFRVTVSGAVNSPGLVPVNALDRVSDAVFMAGGLVEEPPPFPEVKDPRIENPAARKPKVEPEISEKEYEILEEDVASKRNIIVKRRDGKMVRADLIKYQVAGDLNANPYLVDGDVIIVPTIQKEVGEVAISGAVRTPGTFEYAPGDRLRDLLSLGHGFTINADSSRMSIARFENNTSTVNEMYYTIDWQDSAAIKQVLDIPLHPDDRVFVRSIPNYHKKRTIEIQGEVMYPGEYALTSPSTTLSEIIEAAGGFTPQAALHAGYVVRRKYEELKDPEYERLDLMLYNDMEKREQAYYREKSREVRGLVSIDFKALFEQKDSKFDIRLQDDDLIVVPTQEHTINVFGHVMHPGLVDYTPDEDANYYIKKVGGFRRNAWTRKVMVKKAGSGELLYTGEATLERGDTIIVPERVKREFWETFRDVAIVLAQISTATVALFQIQYWLERD